MLSPDQEWAAEIREQVLADCHPWQRDAVMDPARLFAWLVGRGGGKTTSFKAKFLIEMTAKTRARYVFGAPTLGMASELLWEPMKASCSALDIKAHWQDAPREGGKIVTFERTGSRLKLFGADRQDQIDLLRGQAFDGVAGDEVALWNPERLSNFQEKIIEPRQGERDGWLGFASTPGHILRGPFFNMTNPKMAINPETGRPYHRPYADRDKPEYANMYPTDCSSHFWNLSDVASLPDAERKYQAIVNLWRSALARKLAKGWSDSHPIWLREYMGRWAADNTTTVFRFDPDKNLWNPAAGVEGLLLLKAAIAALPRGHTWHFVIGDDQGHGDPFACNVYAFSPTDPDRMLWHVFFHERTGMYARPIAELTIGADCIKSGDFEKPDGIIGITGWPDGMVMDSDMALIDELNKVYGLRFEKAERKADYKFGAIELTNGDLIDGRIKVLEGSPLHHQLQELQWAETDSGVLKENKAQPNHSTDTLIFSRKKVAALFESGVVAQESAPANPFADPMGLDPAPGREERDDGDALQNWYGDDGWGNA